jgi:hypothetical protein
MMKQSFIIAFSVILEFVSLNCYALTYQEQFQKELKYCNEFPKTEEFKQLEKFTIKIRNGKNLDFYYDNNNKTIIYVDRRAEVNNLNNTNLETDIYYDFITYINIEGDTSKITNIGELLNNQKRRFCIEPIAGCDICVNEMDYICKKIHYSDCMCEKNRFVIYITPSCRPKVFYDQ